MKPSQICSSQTSDRRAHEQAERQREECRAPHLCLSLSLLPCLPLSVPCFRNGVHKRSLVENLDLLLLAIDEILDDGSILETDAKAVVGRVCMMGSADGKDVPISEQTFSQALQTARDQLVKSFR